MQLEGTPSSRLAVRARGITKCFGDVVALEAVDQQAARRVAAATPGVRVIGDAETRPDREALAVRARCPHSTNWCRGSFRRASRCAGSRPSSRRLSPRSSPSPSSRSPAGDRGAHPHQGVHLPGVSDAAGQAVCQLDATPNGRSIAGGDRPQEVNGYFTLHTSVGGAPNPLWQFDALVDLLAPTPKG